MMTTIYILSFVFGTIVGSFLNVLIFRLHTGMSILGRSKCFSCSKELRYFEMIPLLSFAIQKGRCRSCMSKISWQYPIVEFVTGLLFFLSVYFLFPPALFLNNFYDVISILCIFAIMSLLVLICVYDIKHKIIPDILSYTFAGLSLFFFIYSNGISDLLNPPLLYDLLAGPALALPFALLWLVSKGRWMGLGDAKLMLGVGWLLGWYGGLSATILAFWIGALAGLSLIALKGRKYSIKSEIPFAPFIILSTLLVLFFGIDIFTLMILQ